MLSRIVPHESRDPPVALLHATFAQVKYLEDMRNPAVEGRMLHNSKFSFTEVHRFCSDRDEARLGAAVVLGLKRCHGIGCAQCAGFTTFANAFRYIA